MKRRFWKLEYSLTILGFFAIALLFVPSRFIASKEAAYISRWNETFHKMEYVFDAMCAQADSDIVKSLKKATDNEKREQLMINLVKPYLRVSEMDAFKRNYQAHYLNGEKVKDGDFYHFDNLYLSKNSIILGIKDIVDDDIEKPGFMMMFDINGAKGPNTWGKDIYGINIFADGKITPLGTGWGLDELKRDCSTEGSGISCSHFYRIGGEFKE